MILQLQIRLRLCNCKPLSSLLLNIENYSWKWLFMLCKYINKYLIYKTLYRYINCTWSIYKANVRTHLCLRNILLMMRFIFINLRVALGGTALQRTVQQTAQLRGTVIKQMQLRYTTQHCMSRDLIQYSPWGSIIQSSAVPPL